MGEFEQTQSAIESQRQGTKRKYSYEFHEISDGVMGILDYVNIIDEKRSKLSGIIEAIRMIDLSEFSLGDLGAAMHDYTNAIEQLTTDLWDHVKNAGLLCKTKSNI